MKAILIDDEPLALQYLERQLNKIGSVNVIDTFVQFEIEKHINLLNQINLVFLDIEMPEVSGLEIAEKIVEVNPNIAIVFVTAYNDYAVQAFELNALDYILKPVRIERLETTIQRVIANFKNNNEDDIQHNEKLQINVGEDLSFLIANDVSIVNWRTTKAKELFLYLLHNKEKIVHKAELVELFWGEFEKEKAFSLLYTTVYHVRRSLKKFHNNLQLKNKQDGYILMTNDVLIDLVEWEKQVNNLSSINENNIEHYEKSMELYTGAYLENCDYLWVDSERYRLENKWISIALKIGTFYFDNGNSHKAESWLINICQVHPDNENAHFLLMKLYNSLNYGILVKHQYEKLTSNLKELGLNVNSKIDNWYVQWRKG